MIGRKKTEPNTYMFLAQTLTLISHLLLLSSVRSSTPADDNPPSAYQVLQDYNFPVGILPKGALGYELDRPTGKFKAYFNGSCGFSLEGSYQLKYKPTISGFISKNRLTGLSGVSVKILFMWLNIVEVVRDAEGLEFSVGIASASFSIDNFSVCPQCGCGLNCDRGRLWKLRTKSFISSV